MASNTTEHSPHDHDEYSCQPEDGSHFPAVPLERLICFISPFEFYAHASFSSDNWRSITTTLFLGVGLYELTLDTNTATTPRKSRFCDRQNISTMLRQTLIMNRLSGDRSWRTSRTRTIFYENRYIPYQSAT